MKHLFNIDILYSINKKISISAVGLVHQDHLSKYFRKIFVNKGNIINSSYTTNYNNFLLNADILFPKHVNLDFLDSKFNYQQNVFINSTLPKIPFHVIVNKQNKKLIHDPNIIKINTSCSDNCGIIYKHLSLLEGKNAIINRFSSLVEPAPISSTPLFSMELEAYFHKNDSDVMNSTIKLIKSINKDNNYEISLLK